MSRRESWSPADSGPRSSLDTVDKRQRLVLAVLQEASVPLSLADLAREIIVREGGSSGDWDIIQRCQAELYHIHVPILADREMVEFDAQRKIVGRGVDGNLSDHV